ncbi:MAG: malate dehydrogenase [Chloroflexi bacterium]|nr:malate dehydrogenase [Chloroflexota bacterium]
MNSKITIVGAGNVGATCAQRIVEKGYADVVLVDIIEGLPQGKALDIQQSASVIGFDTRITGTNGYEETADSDIVVITSGIARKPGMSRDDLLRVNADIVSSVVRNVVKHSPECIIISVTNPCDAMTWLALRTSGFPRNRVFGLSGVLDGARFASFIADELKVSPKDVSPCIMGQHGEQMVVIPRLTTVKSKPLTELLPPDTIKRLVERTINGGAEIVGLLKTGSAFYAPSAAVARMAEAVVLDKKEVLCCAAYLEGEYGIRDTVLGVPVKLGRKGIEQIVEHKLTPDEKQALHSSAEAVRKLAEEMKLA